MDVLAVSRPPISFTPVAGSASPLTIAYRPIVELKPDPKNPRKHSAKQVRQIANSIRQFGFVGVAVHQP